MSFCTVVSLNGAKSHLIDRGTVIGGGTVGNCKLKSAHRALPLINEARGRELLPALHQEIRGAMSSSAPCDGDGDRLWDVQDLDRWIDSLKESSAEGEDILR